MRWLRQSGSTSINATHNVRNSHETSFGVEFARLLTMPQPHTQNKPRRQTNAGRRPKGNDVAAGIAHARTAAAKRRTKAVAGRAASAAQDAQRNRSGEDGAIAVS